ncbi:unnamed protein product, partial [Pleuronectes platessa]
YVYGESSHSHHRHVPTSPEEAWSEGGPGPGHSVVCFLLGLTFITEGGIIPFRIVDGYGANGSIFLFIACLETIIIGWVYGADRFYDNIEDMIGYRPNP